jgi:hypothetical protein
MLKVIIPATLKHVPLIPAHAGIQGNKRWSSWPLGPRFRGDERR